MLQRGELYAPGRIHSPNRDAIVAEWEEFAGTRLPAAGDMTIEQLRDHIAGLLDAATVDLETEESGNEQKEKSRGQWSAGHIRQVAREHAMHRTSS
jgi:hypothetical protein